MNYTSWKLDILIQHSECYYLFSEKNLIGFARVLTDYSEIASLWDVVIHKAYRKNGLGKALMNYIFSDPSTQCVNQWVLYTDDAHDLYKKFGFVSIDEIKDFNLIYKLRPSSLPYSETTKQRFFALPPFLSLSGEDTSLFLETKRHELGKFWSK